MSTQRRTSDLQTEEAWEENTVNLDAWMTSLDRLERMRRKQKVIYPSKAILEQRRRVRSFCG